MWMGGGGGGDGVMYGYILHTVTGHEHSVLACLPCMAVERNSNENLTWRHTSSQIALHCDIKRHGKEFTTTRNV